MFDPFRKYSIKELSPYQCPICAAFETALDCVADGDLRAKILHERTAHRREHLAEWMECPECQPIITSGEVN